MSGNGVEGSNDTPDTAGFGQRVAAREIVVTVGDSPAAAAALGRAAEQSRRTGVPLRIVHAWQMTAPPSGEDSASFWVASSADARARATRWVLDTLGDSAASVRWILNIVEPPAGPIVPVHAPAAGAALELTSQPGGNA